MATSSASSNNSNSSSNVSKKVTSSSQMIHEYEVCPETGLSNLKHSYMKGKFLGKGGFARCYELLCIETGKKYAGKIISKASLTKPKAKLKLKSEIEIHSHVKHDRVVSFVKYFEDAENHIILLELCKNQTMSELLKRRKRLTELEARYYLSQLIDGVAYLHQLNIIHRDLKLGNIFISSDMQVKLGDFGLATKVDFKDQRRRTMCGTPNYIAPEILSGNTGHSFEVDIWSIGVILYTLLIGRPPYETKDVKSTYKRIKANAYSFPESATISSAARDLIRSILQTKPASRPSLYHIRNHPFFTSSSVGIPSALPISAIYTTPRSLCSPSEKARQHSVAPLRSRDINIMPKSSSTKSNTVTKTTTSARTRKTTATTSSNALTSPGKVFLEATHAILNQYVGTRSAGEDDLLSRQVQSLTLNNENKSNSQILWITQWVDYTTKYGMGYLLSDGSSGVYFNDATKIILHSNGKNFEYVERSSRRKVGSSSSTAATTMSYTIDSYDEALKKKVTLLQHFFDYLSKEERKSGNKSLVRTTSRPMMSNGVYVRKWMKTRHAVLFCLTNETIQVNFYDKTQMIIFNGGHSLLYMDKTGKVTNVSTVDAVGNAYSTAARPDVGKRLKYAKDILHQMLACGSSTTTGSGGGSAPPQVVNNNAVEAT